MVATVNPAKNQIANWAYDANGNVSNDGVRTYTYDVREPIGLTGWGVRLRCGEPPDL